MGLTGQGGSRAVGTTLRDLATILQWEQTDTAQFVHLLEVWSILDFQAYHHLLNVISFFHLEGGDCSAHNVKATLCTGSSTLCSDVTLVNRGCDAVCTRITPLALPGWFTILGVIVTLFGPSSSPCVQTQTGCRVANVHTASRAGIWAGSAHCHRELGCNLVLCKILMDAVVCTGPAFERGFGREMGGRCLPETAVSLSAFSCFPALIDLSRS